MADEEARLSRRERRERERSDAEPTLSADDLLAAELERQLAPFRTEEALNPTLGMSSVVVPTAVVGPIAPIAVAETPGVVSAPADSLVDVPADSLVDDSPVELEQPFELARPIETEYPVELEQPAAVASEQPQPSESTPELSGTRRRQKRLRPRKPQASPVVPATMISTAKTGVSTTRSRSKVGARIFSWIAIVFVAGIALASSIPAIALLTPEQVAYQAEMERVKFSGQIGDTQSLLATGEAATTERDAVSVTVNAASSAGVYQPKRLKVLIPPSPNPAIWPFPHVHVSSPFGYRPSILGTSTFHTGLDFDLPYGTSIQSVADGVVSYIEDPGPMCGSSVMIDSNVGGTQFTAVYCHMVMHSTTLTVGQSVKAGDIVGQIGLTGITTGAHLHLEIRINDVPIDPWAFLVQRAGNPPS